MSNTLEEDKDSVANQSDCNAPTTKDMSRSDLKGQKEASSNDDTTKTYCGENHRTIMILVNLVIFLPLLAGAVVKLYGNRTDPHQTVSHRVSQDASAVSPSINELPSLSLRSTVPCESSFGICASTYDELGRLNLALRPGETVAVCDNIQMEDPIIVLEHNVTFCCAEGSRCSLQSGGSQVFVVRSANVTLRGLSFERGVHLGGKGGNVMVEAPGGHLEIANSAFLDGSAETGGNLHIQGPDSVLITNSRFEFGTAENGSGVAIENTHDITIQQSFFDFNRCENQGGGLLVYSTQSFSVPYTISFTMNRFTSNGAGRGAGFYLRSVAEDLRLRVEDSFFGENEADVQGGVGFIIQEEQSNLTARFSGNIGTDNTANSGPCQSLFFRPFPNTATGSDCRLIDEEILYLPDETTPSPTSVPSQAPTLRPISSPVTSAPTISRFPTLPMSNCEPSLGFCASDFLILSRIAFEVAPGDIIAICAELYINEAITISQSNITLCCADNVRCSMESNGDRILVVTGENIKVEGLTFEGGSSPDGDGGNVVVEGGGNVQISNCAFRNGNAIIGGNLHVQEADTVAISNSIFEFGTADLGGGLSIRNTPSVLIEESYFRGNRCGNEGGSLLVASTPGFADVEHIVSMTTNSFIDNGANQGAAFYFRSLGSSLTLRLSDSYFEANGAAIQGGVGFILQNSTINAILEDNIGINNEAISGACDGLFFQPFPNMINGSGCRSIDERMVYLPGDEVLPPTMSPTPGLTISPQSFVPTVTSATPSCQPSSGFCAQSYDEFERLAQTMAPDDTISLCGNIVMSRPIVIDQPNATVCCADDSRCVVQSLGERILVLTGRNPILIGLAFDSGSAMNENGGNVLVDSRGHVTIVNCAFRRGNAVYGGNVHIQNPGSVSIFNSIFESGTSDFGGGLSIQNAPRVTIEDSFFNSNRCGSEGGGLYLFSASRFQDIEHTLTMTSNRFTGNSANRGGAFYLRKLGNSLNFLMSGSYFGDNAAAVQGGEGFVLQNTTVDIALTDNIAEDNVAIRGACNGIFFRPFPNTIDGSDCRSVGEDMFY